MNSLSVGEARVLERIIRGVSMKRVCSAVWENEQKM